MKVLLVHNFYGSAAPSGENQAYRAERDMLRASGFDVAEYTRDSDEIRGGGWAGLLRGGLATPWNPVSAAQVADHARDFDADVVHVHNTFPLISPAIFWALRRVRSAVVATLHNYRTVCASALLMRNGEVCTRCLDARSVIPGIRYGCYRESVAATLPLAASISIHRRLRTWTRLIDAYVTLTEFQRRVFTSAGFPSDALHVKANAYVGIPEHVAWQDRPAQAIFVGRLSAEKGIEDLLWAWKLLGAAAPSLDVVGDGPLRHRVEQMVFELGLQNRVQVRGALDFDATQHYVARSRVLLVPSRCFEGYPMVIREAFAHGVPVIASDIGSLGVIVRRGVNGELAIPGNPESLALVLRQLWNDEERMRRLAEGAAATYRSELAVDANVGILRGIYDEAIRRRQSRGLS